MSCADSNQNPPIVAGDNTASLRSLSQDEAQADFVQLVAWVKGLYAPLEYKERRFKFKIEDLAKKYSEELKSAQNDVEIFGLYRKFLSEFHDGHININFDFNSSGVDYYAVPIFISPFEDRFIITSIAQSSFELLKVSIGDELLSIDGQDPKELMKIINQYYSNANEISSRQNAYFMLYRPAIIKELKPTKRKVLLKLSKPDGTTYETEVTWSLLKPAIKIPNLTNPMLPSGTSASWGVRETALKYAESMKDHGGVEKYGQKMPIFFSPNVIDSYRPIKIGASRDLLMKINIGRAQVVDVPAYIYKFADKTILLLRVETFSPEDLDYQIYLANYAAILEEYQSQVDVLVLDVTHNPGGILQFAQDLSSLFVDNNTSSAVVLRTNADRAWLLNFNNILRQVDEAVAPEAFQILQTRAAKIEQAYDRGDDLSEALPLDYVSFYITGNKIWQKPMLVLTDELSASSADAFPMLIKNNKIAKIFGQTTAGLGGSVEVVGSLINSSAEIRLTRSLFSSFQADANYSDEMLVENNGVEPDYKYEHTVEDFRNGYIKYFQEFSLKALEQIPGWEMPFIDPPLEFKSN